MAFPILDKPFVENHFGCCIKANLLHKKFVIVKSLQIICRENPLQLQQQHGGYYEISTNHLQRRNFAISTIAQLLKTIVPVFSKVSNSCWKQFENSSNNFETNKAISKQFLCIVWGPRLGALLKTFNNCH